jgi:signal peptidase II
MRPVRLLLLLAVLVVTVGCDRITKHFAMASLAGAPDRGYLADTVRLEYAENTGGFLSIGSNLPASVRIAIFSVATGFLLVALLIVAIRYQGSDWHVVAIGLAFAGGASNLLDRITRGAVVDFLNVGVGTLRTGIFNIADVAILAGICLFLVSPKNETARP